MKFKTLHLNKKDKDLVNIKKLWNKNELRIISKISSLTGLSLKTDKIICYIDGSTADGYYGGRTVTLGVRGGISKDDALMVITHEIFHIFYWRKLKKMKLTKSSPGSESKQEWKLAEVTAFLITNEPSLKRYWAKAKVYLYPEVKDVYRKVKKYWKKGDIDYFMINSYNAIK